MTETTGELPPLLTAQQAASALGLKSPVTLRAWRRRGIGPRFVKLGAGGRTAAVRYQQSDLLDWIEQQSSPAFAEKQ